MQVLWHTLTMWLMTWRFFQHLRRNGNQSKDMQWLEVALLWLRIPRWPSPLRILIILIFVSAFLVHNLYIHMYIFYIVGCFQILYLIVGWRADERIWFGSAGIVPESAIPKEIWTKPICDDEKASLSHHRVKARCCAQYYSTPKDSKRKVMLYCLSGVSSPDGMPGRHWRGFLCKFPMLQALPIGTGIRTK